MFLLSIINNKFISDDSFGYDDGTRAIPDTIKRAIYNNLKLDRSNFSSTQLANFGRDFENSKLWVLQSGDVPLDQSYSVTYGDTLDGLGIDKLINDPSATMGFMFTSGLKSSWDTQEGIRQTGDLQSQGGIVNVVVQNNKTFRIYSSYLVLMHPPQIILSLKYNIVRMLYKNNILRLIPRIE